MSSRYLLGTRKSSQHVTLDVKIRGNDGEVRTVKALLDSGTSGCFVAPRLLTRLRMQRTPAHITMVGIGGHVIMPARDSTKVDLDVRYFDREVVERDVLCVPIRDYDLVLGLPWFTTWNPQIDWDTGQILGLKAPEKVVGADEALKAESDTIEVGIRP